MNIPRASEQLRYFRRQQAAILDTIEQLVTLESPSDVKASVDRVSTVLASRFRELGGKVTIHPAEKFGNHLQADFGIGERSHFLQKRREMGHPREVENSGGLKNPSKPILLLGHMDTVYPVGTIAKMPFRVAKNRVWGPGVFDMKSGIALALHVLDALLQWSDGRLPRPVTVLLVSDDEIGSPSSRAITEKLARQSDAVLVLEPAAGRDCGVKTPRTG